MEENNENLDLNPLDASDKRCDFVAVCSTCYYFFYLANMQIKKICIRVSGQVDEFRNPMKTELKTRPFESRVFNSVFIGFLNSTT